MSSTELVYEGRNKFMLIRQTKMVNSCNKSQFAYINWQLLLLAFCMEVRVAAQRIVPAHVVRGAAFI